MERAAFLEQIRVLRSFGEAEHAAHVDALLQSNSDLLPMDAALQALNDLCANIAPWCRAHALNNEQIDFLLGVTDQAGKGGQFWCHTCRSTEHTRYTVRQKRSADEGGTACVQCTKCGGAWNM